MRLSFKICTLLLTALLLAPAFAIPPKSQSEVRLRDFDTAEIDRLRVETKAFIISALEAGTCPKSVFDYLLKTPDHLISLIQQTQALNPHHLLERALVYEPRQKRAASLTEVIEAQSIVMALDPSTSRRCLDAYQFLANTIDDGKDTCVFTCEWPNCGDLLHAMLFMHLIEGYVGKDDGHARQSLFLFSREVLAFLRTRMALPLSAIQVNFYPNDKGHLSDHLLQQISQATQPRRVLLCAVEGLPWTMVRGYKHPEDAFDCIKANPKLSKGIELALLSDLLADGHVEIAPLVTLVHPDLQSLFCRTMNRCCNSACCKASPTWSCPANCGPLYCDVSCMKASRAHQIFCKAPKTRTEKRSEKKAAKKNERAAAVAKAALEKAEAAKRHKAEQAQKEAQLLKKQQEAQQKKEAEKAKRQAQAEQAQRAKREEAQHQQQEQDNVPPKEHAKPEAPHASVGIGTFIKAVNAARKAGVEQAVRLAVDQLTTRLTHHYERIPASEIRRVRGLSRVLSTPNPLADFLATQEDDAPISSAQAAAAAAAATEPHQSTQPVSSRSSDTYNVEFEPLAEHEFEQLSTSLQIKFDEWRETVQERGLSAMRQIHGYNSEKLKGADDLWSVRLNDRYRIVYQVRDDRVYVVSIRDYHRG